MPSSGSGTAPAAPHNADAVTNSVDDIRKNGFLPYMSDSFAKIGTDSVDVSRYIVATHGYRSNPESCAMIRGSAVPTMVWSSDARSIASIRPAIVPTSCGRVRRTSPDVWYWIPGSTPAAVCIQTLYRRADAPSH